MADRAARHRWPWLAALVVLGVGGAYLGAPSAAVVAAAAHRLEDVRGATLAILVGGALGLVAAEALRIAVVARLVGARVGARDAWDAAVANHVMTAVTPQVGLGEPTVAYVLGKRGVPWDAAVAIPFIKFTTSLALVFVLGALLVISGYGPPVDPRVSAAAVALFLAIAVVTTVVIIVVARRTLALRVIAALAAWCNRRRVLAHGAWAARIERAATATSSLVERLAHVRRMTRVGALALVMVHLVYYAAYVAPLVGLALVLGDPPFAALTARALVYLCFVFAMPTPGGAGPSEVAAGVMFGDLIGADDAIAVVIVFRAATFYLQLAIGVVYLPIAAALAARWGRR